MWVESQEVRLTYSDPESVISSPSSPNPRTPVFFVGYQLLCKQAMNKTLSRAPFPRATFVALPCASLQQHARDAYWAFARDWNSMSLSRASERDEYSSRAFHPRFDENRVDPTKKFDIFSTVSEPQRSRIHHFFFLHKSIPINIPQINRQPLN